MATPHGRNAVFKLDDASGSLTDITTHLSSVDDDMSHEAAEATGLGDKGMVRVAGLDDGAIDFEGYLHPTILALLGAAFSQVKSFEWSPNGTGTGNTKFSGECIVNSLDIEIEFDKVVTFSGGAEVDDDYTRGTH